MNSFVLEILPICQSTELNENVGDGYLMKVTLNINNWWK